MIVRVSCAPEARKNSRNGKSKTDFFIRSININCQEKGCKGTTLITIPEKLVFQRIELCRCRVREFFDLRYWRKIYLCTLRMNSSTSGTPP